MKIAFLGGIAMRGFEDTMNREAAKPILAPIQAVLKQADIRIANWENPTTVELSPIEKSGPALHSKPQNIGFLQEAGVELAVLANNHGGDHGPEGALESMRHLADAGIASVGAGKDLESACKPQILEHNGETVAVFAVREHEFGFAAEARAGTAPYDHIRLARDIRKIRPKADFVVAVMHCGNEYCPIPSPLAMERYRDLADCGADAVIGMHPHCMQGYEEYHGAQIVYSTGNFFFGYPSHAERALGWNHGYVPIVELQKGKPTGMEIFPYQFPKDCSRIVPFEGENKKAIMDYIDRLNEPIHSPELHKFLYDGWCSHVGDMYAMGLGNFKAEYRTGTTDQRLYDLSNLLSCEAHHELLNNYLRNLMEHRWEAVKAGIEPVLELSRLPVSMF